MTHLCALHSLNFLMSGTECEFLMWNKSVIFRTNLELQKWNESEELKKILIHTKNLKQANKM